MTKHPGKTSLIEISEFVSQLRWEAVPSAVLDKVKTHFLDTLGASLAGTRSREFSVVSDLIDNTNDGSVIWGTNKYASMRDAALLNGIAAHVFELDDTGGCDHSGAVVVPAVLAAANHLEASGKELLLSVLVGYEVGRRVLEASGGYDGHNGAGWHSTGTCGAIGAAAAVAKLWRLNTKETANAITIATSFSSGLWAFIHDGSQTKKLHAGRAAEGGLLAAQLAKAGISGPSLVFDDVWGGFFKSFIGKQGQPDLFTADLGSVFKVSRVSLKPYASCRGTHSAVDALGDILADTGRTRADISFISLQVSAFLDGMCGRPDINPLAAAQMSLPLAIALFVEYGDAGLQSYSKDKRQEPNVLAALQKIKVVVDQEAPAMAEPMVQVHFNDGCVFERRVEKASGSPDRPMNEESVRNKYRMLAGMALPAASVEQVFDLINSLSDVDNIAPLLAALRNPNNAPSIFE